MEAVATNTLYVIAKFLAFVITIFSPPPEPLAQGVLPLQLISATEFVEFSSVSFTIEPGEFGESVIKGSLSAADAITFTQLTARNVGNNLDFVICEQTLMSPRVMAVIEGGEFLISGPEQRAVMIDFLENGCP